MEKAGKVLPIEEKSRREAEARQDWYGILIGNPDDDGRIDESTRDKFNRAFEAASAGSFREAFRGYQELASGGCPVSQYYLGKMYLKGSGTLQDYCLAHMWFNIAASQDYKKAAAQLEKLTSRMNMEQLAEAQKMAREWIQSQDR